MKLLLSLLLVAVAHCQDLEPVEILQNVMAEHAMTPALYYKASMSLDLDLAPIPEMPWTVVWGTADWSTPITIHLAPAPDGGAPLSANSAPIDVHPSAPRQSVAPISKIQAGSWGPADSVPSEKLADFKRLADFGRLVDSDAPPRAEAPLPVHTAAWSPPTVVSQCPGVCGSYSGQGAAALEALTGKRIKGVQLVAVEICSTHPATFGAGLILQTANQLGIQTHAPKIGSAIVSHTVSLNWRNVAINTVKVGTMIAASLTVSGVIAASTAIKSGLVIAHAAADSLPMLFAPGAPNPDPYLSSVLDANGTITVTPDRCVEATFSGVYGKGSVVLSGPVQLLP